MFVGRTQELSALNDAYAATGFQLAVIYGRRRVGKTSLIREFIKGKPDVCFFTAQESNAKDNLGLLSRALFFYQEYRDADCVPDFDLSDAAYPLFSSFADALRSAFEFARKRRLIFVIDEYPYLAKSYPGVSSLLQMLIDENKGESNLLLILSGSSMSFMEHQVLGHESPLYGRRTMQIRVDPFDIFDARTLLAGFSPCQVVELYAVAGGVPLYLEQFDASWSVEENIAKRVLRPDTFLSVEPGSFLLQETRVPSQYNAVIGAIATGKVRPTEIADATGMTPPAVSSYLSTLEELGVVKKTAPLIKATRKNVVYRIADNLFRFWFTFFPKYTAAIEAGMGAAVAHRIIEREFPTFVGPAFEDVARQWVRRDIVHGNIPMIPTGIGSWWGTDPAKREEVEIDVVATGADNELLLGECKWRNELTDLGVLETLEYRSGLLAANKKSLYLFSKAGFTDACRKRAASMGNVALLTVDEMLANEQV